MKRLRRRGAREPAGPERLLQALGLRVRLGAVAVVRARRDFVTPQTQRYSQQPGTARRAASDRSVPSGNFRGVQSISTLSKCATGCYFFAEDIIIEIQNTEEKINDK